MGNWLSQNQKISLNSLKTEETLDNFLKELNFSNLTFSEMFRLVFTKISLDKETNLNLFFDKLAIKYIQENQEKNLKENDLSRVMFSLLLYSNNMNVSLEIYLQSLKPICLSDEELTNIYNDFKMSPFLIN